MDLLEKARQDMRGHMPDVIANLRQQAVSHAPDMPRREAGYSIVNAAGDEAVVRIYDEIWDLGVNALDLANELDTITAPKIRVEINSPGGDVWSGIAIYNSLRAHPAEVTTRVDGIAASIASVILQAGDHRVMLAGSQAMIHNAWGLTVGDNRDHADMVDILAQQDGIIASIYAARSGKPEAGFRELMNAESWMTAAEAVAEGLADEVYEPPSKTKDKAPTLTDRIADVVLNATSVVGDVERLVAGHGEAGAALTGAKREGLVALRDVARRADGLLNDETPQHPDAFDALMANAKRTAAFQAALPPQYLG